MGFFSLGNQEKKPKAGHLKKRKKKRKQCNKTLVLYKTLVLIKNNKIFLLAWQFHLLFICLSGLIL